MKHTREQQLYFLESIRHNFDNPFLKMELRSRKNGADFSLKKYLEGVEFPDIPEQKAKEILWTYIRVNNLKSENLHNAVEGVGIVIESFEDNIFLLEQLNGYLDMVELPVMS